MRATYSAFAPLTLIMPRPPVPRGVAMAEIVSSKVTLFLFCRNNYNFSVFSLAPAFCRQTDIILQCHVNDAATVSVKIAQRHGFLCLFYLFTNLGGKGNEGFFSPPAIGFCVNNNNFPAVC